MASSRDGYSSDMVVVGGEQRKLAQLAFDLSIPVGAVGSRHMPAILVIRVAIHGVKPLSVSLHDSRSARAIVEQGDMEINQREGVGRRGQVCAEREFTVAACGSGVAPTFRPLQGTERKLRFSSSLSDGEQREMPGAARRSDRSSGLFPG